MRSLSRCRISPCMECKNSSIGCHSKCSSYAQYKAVLAGESKERIERVRTWYLDKTEASIYRYRNTFYSKRREVVATL